MAEFCAEHAEGGMVDLKKKRCAHPDCPKIPSYGVDSSKKGEYCAAHALAGMVNVVERRRAQAGCDTSGSHGVRASGQEVCRARLRHASIIWIEMDKTYGVLSSAREGWNGLPPG